MKFRYLPLFLVLMFQYSFAQNNCKIGQLRYDKTECSADGNFFVFLTFEKANTSNSFVVLGNGKNYGTFLYENLPVKIGPLKADCTTDYEFLVKDKEFPDCQRFVEMGTNCCSNDCLMYLDSIGHVCHDATIDLTLYTTLFNDNTAKYKVKINGESQGVYNFGSPGQINGLTIDVDNPVMEIITCVLENDACCDTFYYVNPCYCSISQFKTQVFDCNQEDSTFSVKIDFTATMTGDSFVLGGNNTTYGFFAYNDLPVTIENLPFSATTFYEFLVIDENSSFCFGAYELGIVDSCRFDCNISNPEIDILPCTEDDQFYVRIKFDEENTSHSGVKIRGNGVFYGQYDYGQHYYQIGPLNADCDKIYEFILFDGEDEGCRTEIVLEEPVCCNQECFIGEMSVTENCDGDKLTSFIVNFEHNQPPTYTFNLWANGINLGTFAYGSLPITITNFPFAFPTVEFKVINLADEACRKTTVYVFECKKPESNDCSIKFADFFLSGCEEDKFLVYFSIQAENPGNQGFKVVSENGNLTKTYQYGQTLYNFGPLTGDCITKYSFILQDIQKPDCKKILTMEEAVCCAGDCFIREVDIEPVCVEDTLTGYILNFDHNQDSNKIFGLWANNVKVGNYTFGDLPLTISTLNFNTQTVVFKIVNLENEGCRKERTVEFECIVPANDQCVLSVFNTESSECNNDNVFYIFFSMTRQNTGSQGFKITGLNNNYTAQFNYGESRYKIGPFKGDCETRYRFKIFDIAHPDCLTEWSMTEPVCCGDGCLISGPDITKAECVNGLVDITLNFEHNNTSGSFTLKMNGQVRGTYQYQDLPVIIRNLEPQKVYSFFIKDNEKECSEEFAFTTPECSVSSEETILSQAKVFSTGDDIMISLKNPGQKVTNVVLTDMLGRQMYKTGFSGAEQNIPMGSMPTGIYFITLQNGRYTKTFKVFRSK